MSGEESQGLPTQGRQPIVQKGGGVASLRRRTALGRAANHGGSEVYVVSSSGLVHRAHSGPTGVPRAAAGSTAGPAAVRSPWGPQSGEDPFGLAFAEQAPPRSLASGVNQALSLGQGAAVEWVEPQLDDLDVVGQAWTRPPWRANSDAPGVHQSQVVKGQDGVMGQVGLWSDAQDGLHELVATGAR